jgi:hypothetical protein
LKAQKVHNGRDGYHIAVDGKERILTGAQNSKIPAWMDNDLVTKVAYDWARGSLGTAQNISYSISLQPELLDEMRGLRKDIKNLPRESISMDDFGRITQTIIEGSLRKVTKQNKSSWL